MSLGGMWYFAMNSGRGSFQGSCRWVASPPNFFGFNPSSRAIWIGRSLRRNRFWASAQASRRALDCFTTSPLATSRRLDRAIVVPMRLSMPCRRQETTGHGVSATRGGVTKAAAAQRGSSTSMGLRRACLPPLPPSRASR